MLDVEVPAALPARLEGLFPSFFIAGFECSSHVNTSGRRVDVIAETAHDRFVRQDYARLLGMGIRTAREGLRWHRIETAPGRYDFSSALPMVRAAHEMGIHVVWDLCHYGWPEDVDPFSADFVRRFAGLTHAFVELLSEETNAAPCLAPVNELSFLAWAGGVAAQMPPFERDRGLELKENLARAAVAASEAALSVRPDARLVHIDPVCNVVAHPSRPHEAHKARGYHEEQYHGWDWLAGRFRPDLGGRPDILDVVGVNFYSTNQWTYPGGADSTVWPGDPRYRPLRHMLAEAWERFRRPLFIAETGIEDEERPGWLRYVGEEVRAALEMGVPVEGICLYPILNHPGWEDERHCHNGLWDYADEGGHRPVYAPLAEELFRQQEAFAALFSRHRACSDGNGGQALCCAMEDV